MKVCGGEGEAIEWGEKRNHKLFVSPRGSPDLILIFLIRFASPKRPVLHAISGGKAGQQTYGHE